jgi:hypothetical protein
MDFELRPISAKWFEEANPQNYKQATATIGAGASGTVVITKDTFEVDDEDYVVSIVDPEEPSDLEVSFEDGEIEIILSYGDAENASVSIGSGEDGTVDIEVDTAGDAGNDWSITIVEGSAGGSLGSSESGDDITVTLGMTAKVKATTSIGTGDDGTVNVEVDTAGADGNDWTIAVAVASGNSQALSAALSGDSNTDITVFLGTDENGNPDDAKNTAALIATEIHALSGVSAAHSGEGTDAISTTVAKKNFAGGLDEVPDPEKNTASLIAASISLISGVTATASGEGTGSITSALEKTSFTGGSDAGVNVVGNEAGTIADAINELGGFVATASGDGSVSIVAEAEVPFVAGQWGTPCPQIGLALQGASYFYVSTEANNTKFNKGWRRFTLANY